ncbi:MAG: DUF2207 domain-containing protein [Thermosipho sp. (in: Bacteria)]|nr:DUF2207 domain-containing protein [Thermosipho sp. (in: thermotogales)]
MKKILKWTFIFISLIIISIIIQSFLGNSYLKWFFLGKYEISSTNIEQNMDEEGIMHVHEIITYKMRKPFRGVYRYIPAGRAVEISNVNVWLENIKPTKIEYLKNNNREFEARIWIAKDYNDQISPENIPEVVLHVTYDAKYTFEKGIDVSQVFRQFWGDGWDAPVNNLTAKFRFPEEFNVLKVYTHPKIEYIQNENGEFVFKVNKLPPYTYAEVRFLFSNDFIPLYMYNNKALSIAAVNDEEAKYENFIIKAKFYPVLGVLVILLLLSLTYYFFGREKEIHYEGIYEREIPYKDPPDTVNVIVVNQLAKLDSNGIAAIIMDLYRKDYIKLDKNGKYIEILEKDPQKLPESERFFYYLLKKYAFENTFSFNELKKLLSKDKKLAKEFLNDFKTYKTMVISGAKKRSYLSIFGTVLSYLIGVVSILLSIFFFMRYYEVAFVYESILSSILFVTGAILFFIPRDVFGNWTRVGREYYLKWKNFEKFLLDFSALSEYPPESVVIWEDYIVYATALGIADKVEKHLKKLVPKEIEEASHPYYGYHTYRRYGLGFFTVSSVATSTVSKGSGSGFGGGVGGAGGGSGGGGGGAF